MTLNLFIHLFVCLFKNESRQRKLRGNKKAGEVPVGGRNDCSPPEEGLTAGTITIRS